jgi:hypothetical protein
MRIGTLRRASRSDAMMVERRQALLRDARRAFRILSVG